jgi:molybdopterin synthase sulfur carrier subunit
MSVSVSVPTILRPVTKGEKTVSAEGATLAEVITDLDSRYSGLGDRLVKNGALHRFVNVYVNDEDVRFTGGLETTVAEGDEVTILPAVAGGSSTAGSSTAGSSTAGSSR